ncbi:MAG: terminase small subunit [Solimonas sp.]
MGMLKNAKRERFCQEYLKDFNGARAARDAGYTGAHSNQAAYELLHTPEVAARVAELKVEQWRALRMTREEVLARITRIARFDARDLFDENGALKPMAQWSEDAVAAVVGVEVQQPSRTAGEAAGTLRKVKLADRVKALELLGKHHGVFEADNRQRSEAGEKLLELLALAAAKSGGVRGLVRKH